MDIQELIGALEEMQESGLDAVRIAYQPGYPMQEEISGVTVVNGVVYIAGTGSNDYAPAAVFDDEESV